MAGHPALDDCPGVHRADGLAHELLDTGQRQLVGRHLREQGRALVTTICNAVPRRRFLGCWGVGSGVLQLAQFLVEFSYAYNVYRCVRLRSGNCIGLCSVVL
jgi:hypothetical protein